MMSSLQKNPRKTIHRNIYATEAIKCVLPAKVESVEYNPQWYYIACPTCNKTVHPVENESDDGSPPLFDCSKCDKLVSAIARYKLVLRVIDDSEEQLRFIFFEPVASAFLRNSADMLANEVAGQPPSVLPQALAALVGKRVLFKTGISPNNLKSTKASYRVEIIIDDEDMLAEFDDYSLPAIFCI
ncbi:uncharacterized protein LOC112082901 [Eutrema salsugineum]|uniref:uncharacterized protein LOC112082901 n=1 Tax=Eutrema salsugineum TaxID=72664 RepID=UPI000CED79C4|nr:uncharacterized protein LOC112082901 [Eutrema salsugineum]